MRLLPFVLALTVAGCSSDVERPMHGIASSTATASSSAVSPAPVADVPSDDCVDPTLVGDTISFCSRQWPRDVEEIDCILPGNLGDAQTGLALCPLKAAKQLQSLRFKMDAELDLRPLAAIEKLERLSMLDWTQGKKKYDLTVLPRLDQLKELRLDSFDVDDASAVATMTRLTSLALTHNRMKDVTALAALVNLETLELQQTRIANVTPLAKMTRLKHLRLDQTYAADLAPLRNLKKLETLNLSDSMVRDLGELVHLDQLRELSINRHAGTFGEYVARKHDPDAEKLLGPPKASKKPDLSPLAKLVHLERLDANEIDELRDLSPLAGLTKLQHLGVTHSEVADLTPLSGLVELRELLLTETKVKDLKPIAKLTKLKTVALSHSEVKDIRPLLGLTSLEDLSLEGLELGRPAERSLELRFPQLGGLDSSCTCH